MGVKFVQLILIKSKEMGGGRWGMGDWGENLKFKVGAIHELPLP